jgi:bacteriocin biosynthesis cyclodehydratase domain-containing protein
MRPALKPGLLPVWRNRDTLQIGVDPRRAIALTGMGGAAGLLALLDGSRDLGQVLDAAASLGIDSPTADRVIGLLAAGGALEDFPAAVHRAMPPGLRARLASELATAAMAHGDADGGARTLVRRQAACVRVHGGTRVGLFTASLLSAAGIGRVVSTGMAVPGAVGPPGEIPAPAGGTAAGGKTDAGMAAGDAEAAEMAAGSTVSADSTGACSTGADSTTAGGTTAGGTARAGGTAAAGRRQRRLRRPELVILADYPRRGLPAALVREGITHLVVSASEAIGVVGPLVEPGRSACLRCLDLARAERDPAWPLILAQLASQSAEPPACDTVLAVTVAAQAAAQALAHVDRGAAVPVRNGTLELVLPDWQWRRRTWQPHHRCECGTRRTA